MPCCRARAARAGERGSPPSPSLLFSPTPRRAPGGVGVRGAGWEGGGGGGGRAVRSPFRRPPARPLSAVPPARPAGRPSSPAVVPVGRLRARPTRRRAASGLGLSLARLPARAVRGSAGGALFLGLRPQIRRGDPLNLSILVSGGKETNKDSLSNGE